MKTGGVGSPVNRLDDFGIIDLLSLPVHRGSWPGPGLGDGLRWTGVNARGINK